MALSAASRASSISGVISSPPTGSPRRLSLPSETPRRGEGTDPLSGDQYPRVSHPGRGNRCWAKLDTPQRLGASTSGDHLSVSQQPATAGCGEANDRCRHGRIKALGSPRVSDRYPAVDRCVVIDSLRLIADDDPEAARFRPIDIEVSIATVRGGSDQVEPVVAQLLEVNFE